MPDPAPTGDVLHDTVIAATASTRAATAVVAQVAADPVAQNALSQEPWFQSRVANYGSAVGLIAFFAIVQQIATNQFNLAAYDRNSMAFDTLVLWGGAGVVYGRFVAGLKPMWFRLFGGRP